MEVGLVSVLIPVFNGSKYLRQAIDSVLAQTYPALEIVAVDDGSTDDSAAILAAYGDRVRCFRQPNSGSVGIARNACLREARGEYLAFLDQDDWWLPTKVARQVAVVRADERIGLVHTEVAYYYEATGALGPPQNPRARPGEMVGACYEALLLGNPICNSSVLLRSDTIGRVGGCDVAIRGNTVQDYDLWLRIAQGGFHFGFVGTPETVFRLHAGQGHRDRRAMLQEEAKVLLRHRPREQWRASQAGRNRLTNLYDAMAVAHLDAGDAPQARRCFAEALAVRPSVRQAVRYAASRLPYAMVAAIRRWREALREWRIRGVTE